MRKMRLNTTAINSATTMEYQMPSMSKMLGRIKMAATWNTSVRRKEIRAEVRPSPRAVKKPEEKRHSP